MFEKKTKIVATLSDQRCEVEHIRELFEAGMNVVRINTAHQEIERAEILIENIRKVSEKIAILIDTKGPEVRITPSPVEVHVKAGDLVKVKGSPDEPMTQDCITVNYDKFVSDVPVGSRVLIDDGDVELIAKKKENECLICEVMNSGTIKQKKSINVPSVEMKLPSLSERDKVFIEFAIKKDLDFIAHSFVRNKEDVIAVQDELDKHKSTIKIIAKIENQEGVDNIDEIMDNCYGIMIARGDLAIEIPAEKIPYWQKSLIKKCIQRRKPIIVATQMLHSMIDNPRPTRAEISDVANAVYDKTDALMLSGETAYGKYPVESVKTMSKIAAEVEEDLESVQSVEQLKISNERITFLAESAVRAAIQLNLDAIVTDTMTGRTGRSISVYRGHSLVFALCYNEHVMRQLALSYGVSPHYLDPQDNHRDFMQNGLGHLLEDSILQEETKIVIIGGNFGPKFGASYIEIGTPKELLEKI